MRSPLRAALVVLALVVGACNGGGDETTEPTAPGTSVDPSPGPAVGLSGKPLPPELDRWATAFTETARRLVAVGNAGPDAGKRCRDGLDTLDDDALDNAPDERLDELQEQYLDAVKDFYEACARGDSTTERADALRRATDVGAQINERLTQLDVPQRTP